MAVDNVLSLGVLYIDCQCAVHYAHSHLGEFGVMLLQEYFFTNWFSDKSYTSSVLSGKQYSSDMSSNSIIHVARECARSHWLCPPRKSTLP